MKEEGAPVWRYELLTHATLGSEIGSSSMYGHQADQSPGWYITSDVSVYDDQRNQIDTLEVVSPVLNGTKGLTQTADLMRILVANGFKVNDSCGQHVHFGVAQRSWFSRKKFEEFAKRLNYLYSLFKDDTIDYFFPSSRRDSRWIQYPSPGNESNFFLDLEQPMMMRCVQYRKIWNSGSYDGRSLASASRAISEIEDAYSPHDSWRYKAVNWTTSFWRNGTVEFRQGMATLSPLHTIMWIRLLHKMYTWSYAPEYRKGGRYYDDSNPALTFEDRLGGLPTYSGGASVWELMSLLRMSDSANNYWNVRVMWYKMSFRDRVAASIELGISPNQSAGKIVAKGRRKWFAHHNANQY